MTGRGAEPRTGVSASKLNELLVKMYERRMIRVMFDDPTLPWLPESYWREKFDELTITQQSRDLLDIFEERQVRKRLRQHLDDELANVSAEQLLAEMDNAVPTLWQPEQRTDWGTRPMRGSYGTIKNPTSGDVQPSYSFECYQCGRPITMDGKDHAGRTKCDLTFVDQIDIDTESYWGWHTPKPWHGEEEDDEEGDEDEE